MDMCVKSTSQERQNLSAIYWEGFLSLAVYVTSFFMVILWFSAILGVMEIQLLFRLLPCISFYIFHPRGLRVTSLTYDVSLCSSCLQPHFGPAPDHKSISLPQFFFVIFVFCFFLSNAQPFFKLLSEVSGKVVHEQLRHYIDLHGISEEFHSDFFTP